MVKHKRIFFILEKIFLNDFLILLLGLSNSLNIFFWLSFKIKTTLFPYGFESGYFNVYFLLRIGFPVLSS